MSRPIPPDAIRELSVHLSSEILPDRAQGVTGRRCSSRCRPPRRRCRCRRRSSRSRGRWGGRCLALLCAPGAAVVVDAAGGVVLVVGPGAAGGVGFFAPARRPPAPAEEVLASPFVAGEETRPAFAADLAEARPADES